MLTKGKLMRNSRKAPHGCSLTSMSNDQVETVASGKKLFTWVSIKQFYKKRPSNLSELSLFDCVVDYWSDAGSPWDPHVYGWHDKDTWPPTETYAKFNLVLFKPWCNSINDNKHEDGTFRTTLEDYMWDNKFPANKRIMLIQADLNMTTDASAADLYAGNSVV